MKVTRTALSTAVLAALAMTGCATAHGPGPAPTVTHTVTKRAPAAPPAPAPTVTQTVPEAPSAQQSASPSSPGAGQVIVRFSGRGTQNTAPFTTPGNWALSWAYSDCPAGRSNFMVEEYNTDGSLDPNGISVNEIGTGRGPVATYAYGDAGTHYLSVNTEGCKWSLVPVTV